MVKWKWLVVILLICAGCEDLYQPDLDVSEELLVIDASFVMGSPNMVRIYKTKGFNESDKPYPPVTDAKVSLTDSRGGVIRLGHSSGGNYPLRVQLQSNEIYKLVAEVDGEIYESDYQSIPRIPDIDSVYLEPATKLLETGTDQAAGNLLKEEGAQLYVDISENEDGNFHRFISRKVCQYCWVIEIPSRPAVTMYAWLSMKPWELFNVAGPAEYSATRDISRHPLVFLEQSYRVFDPEWETSFLGWIYICHQYALSRDSYEFYKELNGQLSAEGKLFDPLYTQVRGNLRCVSDRQKVVLGNFELASVREHRFFVVYQGKGNYFMKRIPWFWDIPSTGVMADQTPVWWEVPHRSYPK